MAISEGTVIKVAQNILLPDEQIAVNVFWYVVADDAGSGPLEEEDVVAAAAARMDDLYEEITGAMSDVCIGGQVEVWSVDQATGDLTPLGEQAATWEGISTGDMLPNWVAAICAMKTTNTEVTGRKFLPCFAEVGATDNNLTAGNLALLVAFASEWDNIFISAADVILTPGVYSTAKALFYLASGTTISNSVLGYQRRRKPGVGS